MAEQIKVQIIDVEETDETLKLTALNDDQTAVYELSLGKMKYNKSKKEWSDDSETMERYITNLDELLGLKPDDAKEVLIGREIDVFKRSEDKVSFFDGITVEKPTNDMIGDLEQVEIKQVQVFDTKARIIFEWSNGKNYAMNFNYGNWIESLEKMIPNPAKKAKAEERFKKLTGATFEQSELLVGKKVMCEIKENKMNPTGNGFCELKKFK